MADYPYMPFWTDAYCADTEHLTYEEHGLYLKLLVLLWRTPGQRIPNDHVWIERRFPGFSHKVEELISEFCQRGEKWITQKRLTQEFKHVEAKSRKQRDRAKARWDQEKDVCRGNAELHASGNAPIATPIATPTKKKRETTVRRRAPTPLDETWSPSEESRTFGGALGLSHLEIERELVKFRRHAKDKQRVCSLWDKAFNSWLGKAADFLGKTPDDAKVALDTNLEFDPETKTWKWKEGHEQQADA